jgi:ribokinase
MILIFGSLNIDLVARAPLIPGLGRTVLAPSYAPHYGGKGANQAVAAARIAGPGGSSWPAAASEEMRSAVARSTI